MSPTIGMIASMITALVGNGIVLACVLGWMVIAWRQGFFFTTLFGLGLFIAFVLALTGAGELARVLIANHVPPRHTPFFAYFVIFVGTMIAVSIAVSQWVPALAIRKGGMLGRMVGVSLGAIVGSLLAGAILVGWSMAALPQSMVLEPQRLVWDAGVHLLEATCRFVERDSGRRAAILGGWQHFVSDELGVRPVCSEPFVDVNQSCFRDANERYLDVDGDGEFTSMLPVDRPGETQTGRWTAGILDCYVLGSWVDVTASHPPRMTSPMEATVEVSALGDGLYQATATDPDPCDRLTFRIEQTQKEQVPKLVIHPNSGRVDLTEAAVQEVSPSYEFTVVATDRSGLFAELPVRVKIQSLPARGR